MRKIYSCDREKLLKVEAEGREFGKFLRSQEQFIQTVKGQNNLWQRNAFLTCSWRFLRFNRYIKTIKIKMGKIIGIQKSEGKVKKVVFFIPDLLAD